ncbi:circadian clock-controlled protein daywake-like isoform X4 [Maniola jurtina]|uniref:circadian clock-controlled protein daywake-like isoform X2 n=1 Tax=Maniola jurtina TaxID=191418 RepID=UPI001E68B276|nr:circadian clock-controlled protein daywake-like isoform X2 [Maniola jurtina]XP_045769710.1 circadian clock-controlled protein daywake-like isoform X3 [Maniola jurtina]XP_045769711.1 circadian clock-controlled protein daywake-like isoform X4 [Maniola jurtina]
MRVLCFLAIVAFVASARAGKLPSFMKACSASDPNLNQCVEKVIASAGAKFANGIPELGIKPLDPVELGRIVVNNPALKITFDDTVVTGLAGFRINSYKIQPDKGKAALDFTANVTLKAHYNMDGQVLILPIRGNGDAKIKITNLNILIKYAYETVDGHWIVTDHKDSYKMDRAQFKFTNLFNGNKDLADTTLRFLNDNWSIIMQEIAPPAIDQVLVNCVEEVKKLFKGVPADELLLQ